MIKTLDKTNVIFFIVVAIVVAVIIMTHQSSPSKLFQRSVFVAILPAVRSDVVFLPYLGLH